jgi:cell wall-associated NlpC family hydrolase
MRLSYFILTLAKRILATCLCCIFCNFAIAADWDGEPDFSFANFHLTEEMDKSSNLALFAVGLAGIQYKYGGNSPDVGMDCSGLVRYVFKEILDRDLPRSSEEISHVGNAIEDHDLQPGDLVFFNTLKRAFSHVGIYLGENKFIHSPASGGKVRIENMSVHYWKQRFNGARRIIGWRDAPR